MSRGPAPELPEEDHADYDEPDGYDDAPPWDVDDEDEGGDE